MLTARQVKIWSLVTRPFLLCPFVCTHTCTGKSDVQHVMYYFLSISHICPVPIHLWTYDMPVCWICDGNRFMHICYISSRCVYNFPTVEFDLIVFVRVRIFSALCFISLHLHIYLYVIFPSPNGLPASVGRILK